MDDTFRFLGAQPESLENRAYAVNQVRAEQRNCDDIKQDHPEILEADDDHAVGVIRTELCQHRVSPHGEVQDMKDDEGEDRET